MPHVIGARSFEELADFAIDLCRTHGHTQVVCGPITSGGLGNIADNLEMIAAVAHKFSGYLDPIYHPDKLILKQLDFEPEMWALWQRWKSENPSSDENPILEKFYRRVFTEIGFTTAHFVPLSDTSIGATWERTLFTELDRSVRDVHPNWARIALREWRAIPDSAAYIDGLLAHAPEAYRVKVPA